MKPNAEFSAPNQLNGFRDTTNESPPARAEYSATTTNIVTVAPIHESRKKRCVVSYSNPSGQPITMYSNPPKSEMTNRYSSIRKRPSNNPNRDSDAGATVTISPTTVVAVAPSSPDAVAVVSVVTSNVKLKVPRLPMLRLITQVTVHCPAGGSDASGVDTVCMSTAMTGAPSETVTPLQRKSTPSAAASSASSLLRKISCSCVGTTLTVEFGCGFDEISSFGIVEAACAAPGNEANRPTAATVATTSENRECHPLTAIARIGVLQRYPSPAGQASQSRRSSSGTVFL